MSYQCSLLLHFTGIFIVLIALGSITIHMMNGGTRAQFPARKWAAIWHGVGLLLSLAGGVGLMSSLGIHGAPPHWIIGKFLIWLLLGALPTAIYRGSKMAKFYWTVVLILAVGAATLAIFKPGSTQMVSPGLSAPAN